MAQTLDMRGPWRAALWAVSAAAVLMAAIDLGRRILATNDEARFAMLAQDTLTRGAWLFPQLNGVAYSNKPPLRPHRPRELSGGGRAARGLTALMAA